MGKTGISLSEAEIAGLNAVFEGKPPQACLEWALGHFGSNLALSSSFGAEDVALIDMLWRIDPKARVFTLDTQRLPTATSGGRGPSSAVRRLSAKGAVR